MKQLAGIRVNLLQTIDIESGKKQMEPEIVLILTKTKYIAKGGGPADIEQANSYKTVRFCTNLTGINNLISFFESMKNEIENNVEQ